MAALKKNPDGTPHIHIYVRCVNLDGTVDSNRYRCSHPDCTHWAYRNFLKGKRSICAICRQSEIILDYENLRRAKPNCPKCCGSKKAAKLRATENERKEYPEPPSAPAGVREQAATENERKARLKAERENPALREKREAIEGIMKTFDFSLEAATAMVEKAMVEKQMSPETKQ